MKIGYPCVNLTVKCSSGRTFRLASYSEERLIETIAGNLKCLLEILRFNVEKNLLFFRITSDLIPFASHPVNSFHWQKNFAGVFREIGSFLKTGGIRVAMHPDQFVLINPLDKGVFARSIAELLYHADVLDLLGTGTQAKIQIHAGGVYGDKVQSMRRFAGNFERLPSKVRQRLVVENDERLYDVQDCLEIHERCGIPVVLDVFHHSLNNRGETTPEAMERTRKTWREKDGVPIVDYSSQAKGRRIGGHADTLDIRDFRTFLHAARDNDFDIMLEIKDKELSALRALRVAEGSGKV